MTSSQRRLKNQPSPVAGIKRSAPAPTLLPAFELSSSPTLPRPAKRIASETAIRYDDEKPKYPTPVPTSSTGVMSSSPSQLAISRRPGLQRTLSERAPLGSVPTIELSLNGDKYLIGRSSNASDYQLSTNKLISRVHAEARYIPGSTPPMGKVEIICLGWNGLKVHCAGQAWELAKDDSFTSEKTGSDIILDVQDARVIIEWPREQPRYFSPSESDSGLESDGSPSRRVAAARRSSRIGSPLKHHVRLQSPVSPSPAAQNSLTSSTHLPADPSLAPLVQVYEDDPSDNDAGYSGEETQPTQLLSQPIGVLSASSHLNEEADIYKAYGEEISDWDGPEVDDNNGSDGDDSDAVGEDKNLSEASVVDHDEFSDPHEENDPIIHSFGPFGNNLQQRMQNITAGSSPEHRQRGLTLPKPSMSVQRHAVSTRHEEDIKSLINVIVNRLAFSRVSSTPLSSIIEKLPSTFKSHPNDLDEKYPHSEERIKKLLNETECIGEIVREGKDAAGRPLQSEYYYIPDKDQDEDRRNAVVGDLRKPALRACRKQHKVNKVIWSPGNVYTNR